MTATEPGTVTKIGDGIRRIIAPNPGPMTHWGTNSWLLGERDVAVIDPGPADPAHLQAILDATRGQTISHILVTHAHADHSPLARELAERTGAPVHGFGTAEAGRSAIMQDLAETAEIGGGEGLDHAFDPDLTLSEGDEIRGNGWTLTALHTPGHFAGHLSFRYGDTLFSGDHVMDWSTSLVSPPDGDLGAFLNTSARLRDLGLARCLTGHGDAIHAPADRLDWLIAHRKSREAEIVAALGSGLTQVHAITEHIYREIPTRMLPAAARNVLAHLIDLSERSLVTAEPRITLDAQFRLV